MFLAEHTECERDQDCTVAGATCYGAIPGVWAGQCVISYCHADHCMPKCDLTNPDCPAGFSCYDFGDAEVCYGACEWYVDNGFL